MAVIVTTLRCDLQNAVKVQYLDGNLFSQDVQANRIDVAVFDGEEEAAIGGSVTADVVRADGQTVAATGGTIEGNVASITLPAAAYYVPGAISVAVKLTTSGVVTTIACIVANVYRSSTDTVVDPGTIIPSVQSLITQIETAVASIPADYSSLWTKLAPAFSTDKSYVAGRYVTYDGGLYRFIKTHSGAWSASDVVPVDIGGELSDLKSAFINGGTTVNNSVFSWEQGNISTITGAGSSSNNRVRTPSGSFINLSGAIKIEAVFAIASGYKLGTREYDSEGTYTGNYNSFTETTLRCDLHPGCQYRLVLAKTNDANVTPSDIHADVITCTYEAYTDKSLSEEYKAADAKETGDSIKKANTRINNLITTVIAGAGASFSSLEIGAYRDLSTGSKQTDADDCATSGSLNISKRKAITFTDDDYLFSVLAFSGTPIGSDRFVRALTDGWLEAGEVVTVSKDTAVISVQVKKKDGTDIENSEADTIKSAFKFYSFVDDTLSEQGVPADAKAVGEAVETAQTSFYRADDNVTLVTTASDVYDLFDALVTDHPDFVTKNTLTSGNFTNYEYVFTIGDYNSQNGRRSKDNEIAKPVILITSGVHGYERSSVMSLYTFCKALCDNKYSLSKIIESAVYKVIPVVCPWGYTNDSRINENGVNINRNFASSSWVLTPTGSDYSGAEPGDQDETKVVQNWINANTDAAFVLDWHNSSYTDEISCLLGDTAENAMTFKKRYLFGMNNIIPYWMKQRNINPSNIYAYTGTTTTGGTLKSYAQDKNLLAFTFETSWNVISTGKHSAFSIGTGAEAFGNMILGLEAYMELI